MRLHITWLLLLLYIEKEELKNCTKKKLDSRLLLVMLEHKGIIIIFMLASVARKNKRKVRERENQIPRANFAHIRIAYLY
jgi:hypothetical protein